MSVVSKWVKVRTSTPNVRAALNAALRCPACGVRAGWRQVGRASVRANSFLYRFRCRSCRECVAVKLPRAPGPAAAASARREYETLRTMEKSLSANAGLRALTPVACLTLAGRAASVTRWFDGVDPVRHGRRAGAADMVRAYGAAGQLLRRLHAVSTPDRMRLPLDVADKQAYLGEAYGHELRTRPAVRDAFSVLGELASGAGAESVTQSWLHGDFKPENILYDGRTAVVLDTRLSVCGAVAYDLASFLDHTLMSGRLLRNRMVRTHYAELERAFLDGYGPLSAPDKVALRWAQLYFMLCYFSRDQGRGALRRIFADRCIVPLFAPLVRELRSALDR